MGSRERRGPKMTYERARARLILESSAARFVRVDTTGAQIWRSPTGLEMVVGAGTGDRPALMTVVCPESTTSGHLSGHLSGSGQVSGDRTPERPHIRPSPVGTTDAVEAGMKTTTEKLTAAVRDAVEASQREDRTVTLSASALGCDIDDLMTEVMGLVECDDSVEIGDGVYDCWGTEDDGATWRLEVRP